MIPLFFFDFGYRLERLKNFLIICGFRLYMSAFSLVFRRFLPYFFAHMCACPCRIFVLKFKMRIIYRAIFFKNIYQQLPQIRFQKVNTRLPSHCNHASYNHFTHFIRTRIIPYPTTKSTKKSKQKVIFKPHPHHTQTGDKIATFQTFTIS